MNRGILETIYIELADPTANASTIKTCWHKAYAEEPFIQLVDAAPKPAMCAAAMTVGWPLLTIAAAGRSC